MKHKINFFSFLFSKTIESVFGCENVLAHQSSSTVIFPGKRTLQFGPVAESIYKKKLNLMLDLLNGITMEMKLITSTMRLGFINGRPSWKLELPLGTGKFIFVVLSHYWFSELNFYFQVQKTRKIFEKFAKDFGDHLLPQRSVVGAASYCPFSFGPVTFASNTWNHPGGWFFRYGPFERTTRRLLVERT